MHSHLNMQPWTNNGEMVKAHSPMNAKRPVTSMCHYCVHNTVLHVAQAQLCDERSACQRTCRRAAISMARETVVDVTRRFALSSSSSKRRWSVCCLSDMTCSASVVGCQLEPHKSMQEVGLTLQATILASGTLPLLGPRLCGSRYVKSLSLIERKQAGGSTQASLLRLVP